MLLTAETVHTQIFLNNVHKFHLTELLENDLLTNAAYKPGNYKTQANDTTERVGWTATNGLTLVMLDQYRVIQFA